MGESFRDGRSPFDSHLPSENKGPEIVMRLDGEKMAKPHRSAKDESFHCVQVRFSAAVSIS